MKNMHLNIMVSLILIEDLWHLSKTIKMLFTGFQNQKLPSK